MKQVAGYLVGEDFPNQITLTLSDGIEVEITEIISGEQEKVALAKRRETKVILTFFSLLNNEHFPTTQSKINPDMKTISRILGVGDDHLIANIEKL